MKRVARALRLFSPVPLSDASSSSTKPPTTGVRAEIGVASPFPQTGSLSQVVWADLLDSTELLPMTRGEAMSVPAIAKGRHVVAPKIAGYPLEALRGDEPIPEQPSWITRTDDDVSPWHRMVWTVDDLIFTGWSLWSTRRGVAGDLQAAGRIGRERWEFDDKAKLKVDGKPITDPAAYVLIPGPHEGILAFGRHAIRHARRLVEAANNASNNPSPTLELHQTGGTELTEAQQDTLINAWAAARRGENAGVAFTNQWIDVKEHKAISEALLIEGRNAAAVDMARIIGVAAAMVDATVPKASLNYETQKGRGLEHTDYGLEPYYSAIAARLSLDDVVPRGQRVRFDIGDDLAEGPNPTGPVEDD